MMAETLFFPAHQPEDWEVRRVGPHWVFKLKSWNGSGKGHKPTQVTRVRPGQLNRRRNA